MTLIGLMRICLLTRTRLVVSWIRAPLLEETKTRTLCWSPRHYTRPCWLCWHELLQHTSKHRGPEGGVIRPDRPLIALSGRKIGGLALPCKPLSQLTGASFPA